MSPPANAKGFTLLEVLLAMFILSFALLSITGMQLSALSHSRESYYYNLAVMQLNCMLERLRANTSITARNNELQRWNQINTRLLPQGQGSYQCQEHACTVSISWRNKRQQSLSFSALL